MRLFEDFEKVALEKNITIKTKLLSKMGIILGENCPREFLLPEVCIEQECEKCWINASEICYLRSRKIKAEHDNLKLVKSLKEILRYILSGENDNVKIEYVTNNIKEVLKGAGK